MISKLIGYKVGSQTKISVDATETSFDPKGIPTKLMNTGGETVYFSNATGVSADNYEIRTGEEIFITNKVYLICEALKTSTIKTVQLI